MVGQIRTDRHTDIHQMVVVTTRSCSLQAGWTKMAIIDVQEWQWAFTRVYQNFYGRLITSCLYDVANRVWKPCDKWRNSCNQSSVGNGSKQ